MRYLKYTLKIEASPTCTLQTSPKLETFIILFLATSIQILTCSKELETV